MSLSGFQRRRRELAAKEAEAAKAAKEVTPAVKSFKEMTKKELTAYATENGIDLGTAKTNAELIAAIEKHERG